MCMRIHVRTCMRVYVYMCVFMRTYACICCMSVNIVPVRLYTTRAHMVCARAHMQSHALQRKSHTSKTRTHLRRPGKCNLIHIVHMATPRRMHAWYRIGDIMARCSLCQHRSCCVRTAMPCVTATHYKTMPQTTADARCRLATTHSCTGVS